MKLINNLHSYFPFIHYQTCSSRNQNSFDNDFDGGDTWSSNDIKIGYSERFFNSEIANDKLLSLNAFPIQNSNTNTGGSNDTDWADFDSYFSNFEISDNKAFPVLEQKNLLNSNNKSLNHDHLIDPFGSKKTFAEVAASWDQRQTTNPSDDNANDIKRWPSELINTDESLNATEQTTIKTSPDKQLTDKILTNGPTSPNS